jgi:hypothetical protein
MIGTRPVFVFKHEKNTNSSSLFKGNAVEKSRVFRTSFAPALGSHRLQQPVSHGLGALHKTVLSLLVYTFVITASNWDGSVSWNDEIVYFDFERRDR